MKDLAIKEYFLENLCKRANIDPLRLELNDKRDFHGLKIKGSEVIYVSLSTIFKNIRVISLFRPLKRISRGSCISVSYGCNKSCPICRTGKEENFKGFYSTAEIVGQQETIMRYSSYYDKSFWNSSNCFSVAFAGQGDIAFNFHNAALAIELLHSVFGTRFICNVSTAFIDGIKSLFDFAKETSITPNLQVSLHGSNISERKKHVDSNEDPRELIMAGLAYAKKTETELLVNFGLTRANFKENSMSRLLEWLDPSISRIKFTRLNLPSGSTLKAITSKNSFAKASNYASSRGINYEIFDESSQVGILSGGACGSLLNKIPKNLQNS